MVPEVGVEGGGSEDDLREAGGGRDGAVEADAVADVGDAVEGLRPPLVGGDAEAGDRRSGVDELLDLLVQCESRDEIADSFFHRQRGSAEWEGFGEWVGRVAGVRRLSRRRDGDEG